MIARMVAAVVDIERMEKQQRVRKRPRFAWDVGPAQPEVYFFFGDLGDWDNERSCKSRLVQGD